MKHAPLLAPSILAADHAYLAAGLEVVKALPIQWLHLDIMDGHFVPNLSFGPGTVQALRPHAPALFFDVHLMLSRPDRYVEAFAHAGADQITVHVEADCDVATTLAAIRALGKKCGIVLNPGTEAATARPYLNEVDLVLVMTVWPGFGGQSFIDETLSKMAQLDQWRQAEGHRFRLQVDGGINLETAKRCQAQGVDTFVAGTAFFQAPDRAAFLQAIETPLQP